MSFLILVFKYVNSVMCNSNLPLIDDVKFCE